VFRSVDALLKAERKKREGKEKLCAIHFNRVILYLVFRGLSPTIFEAEKTEADMKRIPALVADYLDKVTGEITKNYPLSYVGNVFKNISKCKAIVAAVP
jgi:hypothetical protein